MAEPLGMELEIVTGYTPMATLAAWILDVCDTATMKQLEDPSFTFMVEHLNTYKSRLTLQVYGNREETELEKEAKTDAAKQRELADRRTFEALKEQYNW